MIFVLHLQHFFKFFIFAHRLHKLIIPVFQRSNNLFCAKTHLFVKPFKGDTSFLYLHTHKTFFQDSHRSMMSSMEILCYTNMYFLFFLNWYALMRQKKILRNPWFEGEEELTVVREEQPDLGFIS